MARLGAVLAQTPMEGRAWKAHSKEGMQGNELPMMQLQLQRRLSKLHQEWWLAAEETLLSLHLVCPRCEGNLTTCHCPLPPPANSTPGATEGNLATHRIRDVDLNRVGPGAAVWPHLDAEVHGGDPTLLVLLQPATRGGLLLVAKERDVSWRESEAGGLTLARRARDTEYVGLRECGDVCCLDGCAFVHEVRQVHGCVPRLTMSVTVSCSPVSL